MIEKEVKQRTTELYRANRDSAQFANVASHDLKTPLRGIVPEYHEKIFQMFETLEIDLKIRVCLLLKNG